MEQITEKVILVGIDSNEGFDEEASLEELKLLAKTAGAETLATIIQARENVHPTTYIGKGKILEVKEAIDNLGATGVIFDDELTPSQMNNLSKELDTKVMDRTVLILDIFASRANTAEGKIQVELAQLRYSLTRLAGYGKSMSRLGGGIGTRGPGESKLE
ncbi:MAG: GTPase HflX, partial [Lachnospiraceae bacterium]|nr:GTPase HflX [Lachnospiraceae bacterium]